MEHYARHNGHKDDDDTPLTVEKLLSCDGQRRQTCLEGKLVFIKQLLESIFNLLFQCNPYNIP